MKLEDIREICVVPYSHHDHAWTNTRQWHVWRYLEGYCQALDLMRENPEYTLLIDNVLHSLEAFYRYCPTRVEEFRARVKEGRISVSNGGMALLRPADSDGELMIRNGCAGYRKLCELFGLDGIPLYFNADTACGASQMPQILRLMGHRYYRFVRPEDALRRTHVPTQFTWRGMDGSEIRVVWGPYGACLFCGWNTMFDRGWEEQRDTFVREDLPGQLENLPTDTLLLNVGLDDCLPMRDIYDRPYDLDGFMRRWNQNENSHMGFASLSSFLEKMDGKELPVWEGPLDECELSYNAPFRVDHSLRKLRTVAERRLVICEKLNTLAVEMGAEDRTSEIEALWDRLYRVSGHAMQHLLGVDYERARDGAHATVALLDELTLRLQDEIAGRAGANGRIGHVLINTTLRERTEIVELTLTTPHHIDGLALRDPSGREMPWQLLEGLRGDKPYDCQFNEVRVAARVTVPPMGYTCLDVSNDGRKMAQAEARALRGDEWLECGDRRIRLSGGLISEITDGTGTILDGQTLVKPRFWHTQPTETWLYRWDAGKMSEFAVDAVTLMENGPLRWKIVASGRIGDSPATVAQTICADDPVIRYALTIDNRQGEGYYTVDLPRANTDADIRAAVPFGEEPRNPGKQIYYDPSRETEFMLQVERGWRGAIFARGYVAYDHGDRRILLLQGDLSTMARISPEDGTAQQLLYRSIDLSARTDPWVTRMCRDAEGKGEQHFSFAVAVLPAGHDPADTQCRMQEQREPILNWPRYSLESGNMPAEFSALRFKGCAMELSAAYLRDGALFLRLYETAGRGGTAAVELPAGCREARAVDFYGNGLDKDVRAVNGTAEFSVRPWEIVNLKLPF